MLGRNILSPSSRLPVAIFRTEALKTEICFHETLTTCPTRLYKPEDQQKQLLSREKLKHHISDLFCNGRIVINWKGLEKKI
jgi:ferredoxin-like protein FixX